jgi:hypothetical protein
MHLMKEASPRFQRISSPRSAKSAQCWWLVLGRRLWQAWLSFWLRSSKVWTFLSRSHKLWLTDICTLGFKSKVEAYEVEARLTACQKVEFVPQEAAIYKDTTTHHLFFVVLRDGTKWAIDLCNAQFCATTTLDHGSGVFPWADYMRQLKATPEDIIDVRPLLANKDTLVDMDLVGLQDHSHPPRPVACQSGDARHPHPRGCPLVMAYPEVRYYRPAVYLANG